MLGCAGGLSGHVHNKQIRLTIVYLTQLFSMEIRVILVGSRGGSYGYAWPKLLLSRVREIF